MRSFMLIRSAARKRWLVWVAGAVLVFAAAPFGASASSSSRESSARKSSAKKKSSKTRSKGKRQRGQMAPTADRIQEIQSALSRGGYYEREPNGRLDSTMQESLRRFQNANGLNPSGKLDAMTLQKLGLGSDTAGVSAPRPPIPAPLSPSPSAANSTIPHP
jgi:peptidoglycan hydrolase-like protein with peptidoglycan-binding domain